MSENEKQQSPDHDGPKVGDADSHLSGDSGVAPFSRDAEAKEPTINLDQFLKTCGVATGGQAKVLIQSGEILVNNEVETRRRKKLRAGDEVTLFDTIYVVAPAE